MTSSVVVLSGQFIITPSLAYFPTSRPFQSGLGLLWKIVSWVVTIFAVGWGDVLTSVSPPYSSRTPPEEPPGPHSPPVSTRWGGGGARTETAHKPRGGSEKK